MIIALITAMRFWSPDYRDERYILIVSMVTLFRYLFPALCAACARVAHGIIIKEYGSYRKIISVVSLLPPCRSPPPFS